MWSTLVESLKRLYEGGSVNATFDRMKKLHEDGKLTKEEFKYITGIEYEN